MRFAATMIISALVGLGLALLIYLPDIHDRLGVGPDVRAEIGVDQGSRSHTSDLVQTVQDEITSSRRSAVVVAAEKVSPAVVSITVIQTRVVTRSPTSFFNDPFFDQFFRDFFGQRRYVERVPALGSGFIVSGDGVVITNEHVIRDASEIKVTLPDAREFDAEILASDPE
ncbi:MAG: trypsin-like peptidase domain-containing protein, partial [bacterium]